MSGKRLVIAAAILITGSSSCSRLAAPRPAIIFMGDSHVARWDLAYHFPGLPVVNDGIGGIRLRGLIDHIRSAPPAGGSCLVIVGINDVQKLLGPDAVTDSVISAIDCLYDTLIIELRKRYPKVRLISVLPLARGYHCDCRAVVPRINARLDSRCSGSGVGFIDAHTSFAGADGYLKAEYSIDGIHLNADGYQLLSNIIRADVE